MSNGVPRFVYVALLVAAVSLALTSYVFWQLEQTRDGDVRRDCERAVNVRDDGRAMWLYLVATTTATTPENQARVDAFVAELNRRLPALECHNGVPVERKP